MRGFKLGQINISVLVLLLLAALALGGCQEMFSNRPPEAAATAYPRSGDAPLEVRFDGSDSYDPDGSITKFNWDFGDGFQSNEISPIHTYADDGSYTVILTVTDSLGATSQDLVQITVTNPEPRAIIDASPTAGPAPLEVVFDASDSVDPAGLPLPEAITFFIWDFGDGETGAGKRITHTYTEAGDFTASLTVVDDDGATATDAVQILVFEDGGTQTSSAKAAF